MLFKTLLSALLDIDSEVELLGYVVYGYIYLDFEELPLFSA